MKRLSQSCKMKKIIRAAVIALAISLVAELSFAATYYVDGSISDSGNGLSWATAWKALSNITGLRAGDTVYISGGSSYTILGWTPVGGSAAGGHVTYQIGQDAGKKGTATFNCGGGQFPVASSGYTTISGDAGDGAQHFLISNYSSIQPSSNTRYSYIDFGTMAGTGRLLNFNGTYTGVEFDHNKVQSSTTTDGMFFWDMQNCSGYGENLVHHNDLRLSNAGAGIGADGFQGNNSCTDFYNNTFTGITNGYSAGQHQDAHQPLQGQFIRIYNNKYENISNYPIFFDGYYGHFSHVRIYNNLIVVTSAVIAAGNPQGIAIGPDGGQLVNPIVFTDIVVANNTIADFGNFHAAISMYNPGGGSNGTWVNCYAYNNAIINSGAPNFAPAVTNSNNIRMVLSSNDGHFVSFTPLSSSNDFHLTTTDSSFRAKGTNLSSYFTTDKDGSLRGIPWDVGAYMSSSDNPMAPKGLRIVN
jgi:hypothetical protein